MTSLPLAEIRRRSLATLIPPERLPLSDWIEQSIYLPEDVSALPGAVRLWPYQREIADAIGDPAIERVTLVKSVRVGFTTLLTGALASFAANEPAPIILLRPTEDDCRDAVVSDIEPIFEASPALSGLLSADTEAGKRNTLLRRRFPGGSLKVIAAKAPRNLRGHNARVLFCDEVDEMQPSPQGSPILLAEKRTLSFANRKIVLGSTPLTEETSNVLRAYAQSDRRIFEVPCPECGAFTEIEWQHIEWQDDQPASAAYRCPHCQGLINERHKAAMVEAGRWRATRPEVQGHAGFRLNALVSTLANASWGKLAAEFLAAKQSPDLLRTFVNTILAQAWSEGEEIDETGLIARAERFDLDAIPAEVLVITAGVDVQDDRLEVVVVGWSREGIMFMLLHHVTWGSPDDDATWLDLDELLRSRWTHPFGGKIGIDSALVDSGDGDWTDKVYSFCFPRANRRIWASKGMAGARPGVVISQHKTKGGRIAIVGVDGLKTTLFSRLPRESLVRFSDGLADVFFEQLVSEKKVVRYRHGRPFTRFEPITGRRNEALDCTVMAMAARQSFSISMTTREEALRGNPLPGPTRPQVVRSKFMDRGRET